MMIKSGIFFDTKTCTITGEQDRIIGESKRKIEPIENYELKISLEISILERKIFLKRVMGWRSY